MRIGYGKVGRTMTTDPSKWGEVGGDNECPMLLVDLATKHPDHTWVCMTKNLGFQPPLPNIENPWIEWIPQIREHNKTGYRTEDQSYEAYFRSIKFYDSLIVPAYGDLDGVVFWIGQHGSSSAPLPKIGNRSEITKAQISAVHYASHAFRGINRFRASDPVNREEVWLIADSRNHLKARDLMWPRRRPILGQFDFERGEKLERYGRPEKPSAWPEFADIAHISDKEPGIWQTRDRYVYSGLELVGIKPPAIEVPDFGSRERFGILINEARAYGFQPDVQRLPIMRDWVKPLGPSWVHGTWPEKSQQELGMSIQPAPYDAVYGLLASAKTTFTTPSSGSGWATAKPWESFSMGTVCFFHPKYDSQGHIIPTLDQLTGAAPLADDWSDEELHLARWLRVATPEQLAKRVDMVASDPTTYHWLRMAQTNLLKRRLEERQAITLIEERLGL